MEGYYDDHSAGNASIGSIGHDFAERVRAQGAVLGQINVSQPAELRNAIERAQKTCANLSDLHETLAMHLDRILGTRPETVSTIGKKIDGGAPDCEMSALRNVLSDLDDVAYRVRSQVERLARL